jgi:hypothetical protein
MGENGRDASVPQRSPRPIFFVLTFRLPAASKRSSVFFNLAKSGGSKRSASVVRLLTEILEERLSPLPNFLVREILCPGYAFASTSRSSRLGTPARSKGWDLRAWCKPHSMTGDGMEMEIFVPGNAA